MILSLRFIQCNWNLFFSFGEISFPNICPRSKKAYLQLPTPTASNHCSCKETNPTAPRSLMLENSFSWVKSTHCASASASMETIGRSIPTEARHTRTRHGDTTLTITRTRPLPAQRYSEPRRQTARAKLPPPWSLGHRQTKGKPGCFSAVLSKPALVAHVPDAHRSQQPALIPALQHAQRCR